MTNFIEILPLFFILFLIFFLLSFCLITKINSLNDKIDFLHKQIISRNKVIDKEFGINLINPLSLSPNAEYFKIQYGSPVNKKVADLVQVPLYTPDGRYLGMISYSAYLAILDNNVNEYDSQNDDERTALWSYMNYIDLEEGLSLAVL